MMTTQYFQMIIALIVITVILWGVLRLSKLAVEKKYSGEIKIKDHIPVETNTAIAILEVRKKEYLVSISDKTTTILDTLK